MNKSFGSIVAGFFIGSLVTGFIGLVGWNLQMTFTVQSDLVLQMDEKDDLIKELVKNASKDITGLRERILILERKEGKSQSLPPKTSNISEFYQEQRQIRKGW